jgi:hypothetical protein
LDRDLGSPMTSGLLLDASRTAIARAAVSRWRRETRVTRYVEFDDLRRHHAMNHERVGPRLPALSVRRATDRLRRSRRRQPVEYQRSGSSKIDPRSEINDVLDPGVDPEA